MNDLVGTSQRQRPCLLFAPAQRRQTSDPPAAKHQRDRRLYFAAFLLLAGYVLLCHGCHGDEDNELFASRSKGENPRACSKAERPSVVFVRDWDEENVNRSPKTLLGHIKK